MSRRQAVMSAWNSAMRLMTGMGFSWRVAGRDHITRRAPRQPVARGGGLAAGGPPCDAAPMLETATRRRGRPRLAIAAALVLLAAVAGVAAWPGRLPDRFPAAPGAPDNHLIWVVNHGWHTGLVIDRRAARGVLVALDEAFPDARYIEIGWGDEGFYTAPDGAITLRLALEAMFSSRGAVMHVVGLPAPPAAVFPHAAIAPLVVSDAGFRAMLAAVGESFRRDRDGHAIALRRGLYGDSRFFMALGRYSMMFTCNSWTARMLRETGCPISSAVSLTAGVTMLQAGALCAGAA
jgi:uncharacterized protein (TIGR02117 family)